VQPQVWRTMLQVYTLVTEHAFLCSSDGQERPGATAWDVCMALKENGLLAKPTHGNIIRLAPPLTMSDTQLEECAAILKKTLLSYMS